MASTFRYSLFSLKKVQEGWMEIAANRMFSLTAKKTFTRVIFLCVTISAAVVAVVRPKGHTQ